MGPNGSGKSTLSHALWAAATTRSPRARSRSTARSCSACPPGSAPQRGLFLAMQYPVEVPGVPLERLPRRRDRAARDVDADRPARRGRRRRRRALGVRDELLARGVNVEFSGGEQKRAETRAARGAAAEVRDPRRDRLRSRRRLAPRRVPPRRGMTHEDDLGVLAITHYARVLARAPPRPRARDDRRPDRARRGGPELADELEETGYEGIAADVEPRAARASVVGVVAVGAWSSSASSACVVGVCAGVVVVVRRLVAVLWPLRRSSSSSAAVVVVGVVVVRRRADVAVAGLHRRADDVHRLALGDERREVVGDVHRDARAAVRRRVRRHRREPVHGDPAVEVVRVPHLAELAVVPARCR